MWGGFAFGIFGAILAAIFLRRVGIVGHRPEEKLDEEKTAYTYGDDENKEDGQKVDEKVPREERSPEIPLGDSAER